jgi:TonB family protein
MRRTHPALLLVSMFALTLLATMLPSPLARASDGVADQLKADYLDKVLTLRHSYGGGRLIFQSDGSPTGSAVPGPWTVDGQILVQGINLHGRRLQIRGRRICLVFDGKGKPFRDVLDWLAESQIADREKQEKAFRERTVKIEIELSAENPDAAQVSTAMNAVFLASGESLRDVVPEFWRDYFYQLDGQPRRARSAGDPVFLVKKGDVSVPRGTYMPNPEFSDEARIAKYQGTMLVSLVVDPSGTARDVAIVRPLGLGLDEHAIERVSSWKFEPATKDGTAVPVKIMVEVSFHLY